MAEADKRFTVVACLLQAIPLFLIPSHNHCLSYYVSLFLSTRLYVCQPVSFYLYLSSVRFYIPNSISISISNSQSARQPVNQPVNRSVNQLVNLSICLPFIVCHGFCQSKKSSQSIS